MPIRIHRRFIGHRFAEERRKRPLVFGIIIGPDRRIIALAARSKHRASFGLKDAVGCADFSQFKHSGNHCIRALEL